MKGFCYFLISMEKLNPYLSSTTKIDWRLYSEKLGMSGNQPPSIDVFQNIPSAGKG